MIMMEGKVKGLKRLRVSLAAEIYEKEYCPGMFFQQAFFLWISGYYCEKNREVLQL